MSKIPRLFEIMSERGIKEATLAKSTGISQGNIGDWKRGRSAPTIDKLITVADYLNCSVDYLLGRTDNPNITTGINVTDNKHDIINSDNSININTAPNKKTSELVELIEELPLVKRAEAVLYLNDLKNKK